MLANLANKFNVVGRSNPFARWGKNVTVCENIFVRCSLVSVFVEFIKSVFGSDDYLWFVRHWV